MSERMRLRIVEARRLGEDVRVLLEPAPRPGDASA
jgi:hypothetical protein